jgi:hypothetical protein
MVIPFINGNGRGCQGTVVLQLKPRSFDGIGNFKIWELPYQTKLNWSFKQVTDGNSQLLNRLQRVTDGNKMVILPFVFVYCTLNE